MICILSYLILIESPSFARWGRGMGVGVGGRVLIMPHDLSLT